MMKPKVTIIVPIYNVEKYLDRCMKSLLGQTLKEIEIIMVDDESPDNCPQMCDYYASKYNHVKVVHKKNGGLGYARNSGLDVASGEYVMFVDSDDRIELDTCERFYNEAIEHSADVVTGNFVTEYLPGKWHRSEQPEGLQVLYGKEVHDYALNIVGTAPYAKQDRLYPVSVCLLLIRRSIIEENNLRFYSEREVASEDALFKISLLNHVETLVRVPYAFYYYYLNGASLSHTFKSKDFHNMKNLRTLFIDLLGADDEAVLRTNRNIISDIRMHILRLVNSNIPNKIEYVKEILKDDIWDSLKSYKPKYYPPYQRVFYQLCLWNKPYCLYYFASIINLLKKIR